MAKRIFILLGHPDAGPEPLSRQLADAYEAGAREAGHEVRRMNIFELSFDANLHKGYRAIQELEPDLKAVQENLSWCQHFVLVYPNWWGSMPGLLKGMWDRMFLPRFAFRMWKNRLGWDALLKGRTARVIITCGNPVILDHLAFGDFTDTIKRSLLQFAGFRTWVTAVGRSEHLSEWSKNGWLKMVKGLGRRGR
ncbi:MAG TPA: NAD(P)H-dependent oxidoreductase [Candidatus Paceibacterota bacterium]|nr:NAD(P)H-dependent oxidoreductase [Candidatus Paceibacterota bacterium]